MKLNKVVTETNGMTCLQYHRFVCRLLITLWGAPVAQSIKRWTCDWKVACSNPGLEGPRGTISIFSAPCAVPVFRKRHKTVVPSQSPNGAGSLNLTRSFLITRFSSADKKGDQSSYLLIYA